jgi:hypothetical protein
MEVVRNIYRRLDRWQHGRAFRIVATVIALILAAAYFGPLIARSYSLHAQREAVLNVLTSENLQNRDQHLVSFAETGMMIVEGRTYGDPAFADRAELLFDDQGNIKQPAALTSFLLRNDYPTTAPRWMVEHPDTTTLLAVIAAVWLLLIVWLSITVPFLLTLAGTWIGTVLARLTGNEQLVVAVAGIGLLVFTFVLLTRAAQVLLARPNQMLAVAHNVLKEASRTRIALLFIIAILVALPLIPSIRVDPEEELRYQIQTFISSSLGLTYFLAACLTLVFSCATVAFEIRDRQIWQVVSKPITRLSYLLGKWLGLITLNLILLVIASISIFMFIQYLREQPVSPTIAGEQDRQLVQDAVLTARVGTRPDYIELTEEQLRERVDAIIDSAPELRELDEVPLAKRREIADDVRQTFVTSQRSIPPQAARDYVFTGLGPARDMQAMLTLRYRFHILRDDDHKTFRAVIAFNRNRSLAFEVEFVPTVTDVLSVPPTWIREDGTLVVTVANLYQPSPDRAGYGALNFEDDDFELLYKVDSFEANFFRAVLIDWIKLAFLAMLGVSCATFLNFPVACLTAFTIFVAGTIGPFLSDSLQGYYPPDTSAVDWGNIGMVIDWAFRSVIRLIAQGLVLLLGAFGEIRPVQRLVEGRFISWSDVGMTVIKLGVIWSGFAMALGLATFRKRQLAIYSGHGG